MCSTSSSNVFGASEMNSRSDSKTGTLTLLFPQVILYDCWAVISCTVSYRLKVALKQWEDRLLL